MKKKVEKLSDIDITEELFQQVASLIVQSKKRVAVTINSEMTLLYWSIGKSVNEKVLNFSRAEYGEKIIATLSKRLTISYGKGWSKPQLWNCLRTAETFPDQHKISALSRELSWTHIKTLIYLKDDLKREFYLQLACNEKWGTRVLQERIDSMLFERTALSKKPEELIRKELSQLKTEGITTPDLAFRDPYLLDFLGLQDTYSENDLETAILNHLQRFIIELGSDFTFVARQKRIVIDNKDFRIDLLFYHRGLRRLVALDLKLDSFKAAYKGQMELYLKWLNKYERKESEESPIGLILCSEKQQEQIELLELTQGHIRVAEYLTQLPPKEILVQKLHNAIEIAKQNHES